MKKNRMIIATLLVLTMLSALIAGCGQQAAAPGEKDGLEKVIVSEFRGESWLPGYLAYELGYYKDEGLDVQFATYKDGPIAFQGMHAGDSQFCMLSIEPVLRAFDEGKESKVIFATIVDKPYMLVAAKGKGIEKVSDLKGKVVFAGMPGSAPFSFVTALLVKEGLDPQKDVTWANMEYGASLSALEKGRVDAAYMRSINKGEIEEMGAKILVDASDPVQHKEVFGSEKYESGIVTVTKKFAESNPETIQKFTNAVARAIIWQSEHSDEEIAQMVRPQFEGANLNATRVKYLRTSLSNDGNISQEGYSVIHKFCKDEGIITKDIPYESVIDLSFINKANAQLQK